MKTRTINIYSFNELSEQAKENAINNLCGVGVDYEWWDSIYDDANTIGLKITSFDVDRRKQAKGELTCSMNECIDKIISHHGENTDTYMLAMSYRDKWDDLVLTHSDGENTNVVSEENEYEFDREADELEEDFLKDLCEEYASILQREYEYMLSDEYIIEMIEANEYEFDEKGNLI